MVDPTTSGLHRRNASPKPSARMRSIAIVDSPPSTRRSIRIHRGRAPTSGTSPGAIALRSPTISVRSGPGAAQATASTCSISRTRRRSPIADRPALRWTPRTRMPGPGRSTSTKLRARAMPVPAGLGRTEPGQHGHRSTRSVDERRASDRVGDEPDDVRIRRLLEHDDVGVDGREDVGDQRAPTPATLADVVRDDPDGHEPSLSTTCGWPCACVRSSRNQPAIAWRLTGRRAIACARRRAAIEGRGDPAPRRRRAAAC